MYFVIYTKSIRHRHSSPTLIFGFRSSPNESLTFLPSCLIGACAPRGQEASKQAVWAFVLS